MQGQAVASRRRLGRDHPNVHDAAHTLYQVVWYAFPIALHNIASSHTLCGNDVALLVLVLWVWVVTDEQCYMCTSAWVVLNPFYRMPPRLQACEVDRPYSPLRPSPTMPDSYLSRIVTPSDVLSLSWKGQLEEGSTFP